MNARDSAENARTSCPCPFEHSDSVACLAATTMVVAAKEREAHRRHLRAEAAREVATWPEAVRRRLQRDFDRAAAEAQFISNRGRPSIPPAAPCGICGGPLNATGTSKCYEAHRG